MTTNGSGFRKAEVISNGNVNIDRVSTMLWAVFDEGGQGMKQVGLIAVFTTEKAAKDFVGTKWLIIKPLLPNTPYPNGI